MPSRYYRFPENTLHRVAIDAKKNYREHYAWARFEEARSDRYDDDDLKKFTDQFGEYSLESPPTPEEEREMSKKVGYIAVSAAETTYRWNTRRNIEMAKKHYDENTEAYHKLALINAYIDGVEIVTSEPIVIGRNPSEEKHS